jgi:hypothetical protein
MSDPNKSTDKPEKKVILKVTNKNSNSKKAINIFKYNTWESFKNVITEANHDLSDKKFLIKLSQESNYQFAPFFDEDSFKEFSKYIMSNYENNPNDFGSKNAPICEIEIVENFPKKKKTNKLF